VQSDSPLFALLASLDDAGIFYTLGRHRSDTILVTLTVVGERIEIDVFDDGHMEVARFKGHEDIVGGRELVDDLIREYRD